MSDIEARLRVSHEREIELEAELVDAKLELAREKRTRRRAVSRASKYRDESNWLHGILLTHGIEPRRSL